jgi:hypothetical protein
MVRDGRAVLERAEASPDHVFITYAYESAALTDGGEFEAAVQAVRPGVELMRRHGMHRSHQSWLEGVLAGALIKLGSWTEAAALMDGALARGPVGITRRMVQLQRAELQLARGDVAAASDAVAQARRATEGNHPFAGKLLPPGGPTGPKSFRRSPRRASLTGEQPHARFCQVTSWIRSRATALCDGDVFVMSGDG